MADNHQLVFSDADYEKAAKQWGKEFLLMPLYSCMETLKYMTGMPGTRYKVALPTVEGNAQFAPYRSNRRSNDQTKVDFREIETFFGNVRIDFEPNKQIQMLIGQSAAFLGDGQAQAPSAKTVIASVMKSLGAHLNDALFTAVRNPNGDTTADLFNGWGHYHRQRDYSREHRRFKGQPAHAHRGHHFGKCRRHCQGNRAQLRLPPARHREVPFLRPRLRRQVQRRIPAHSPRCFLQQAV